MTGQPRTVVFSGGSAANSLVDTFRAVVKKDGILTYIIPISDNGGSSSELIRFFGGPGIGDIRSRLVRLIPEETILSSEPNAVRSLFNHRLSPDRGLAKDEWLEIVEGRHSLWKDISAPKKELIRSFFNLLNLEIVKRARPSSVFNFSSASVGNLFLTGTRLFSGSFESAIYLLASIGNIPTDVEVVPAINTNFSHHISAGLEDGTVIVGQNAISHPTERSSGMPAELSAVRELEEHDNVEDANLPGSLPMLRKEYINFSKSYEEDLQSRIKRIWYINPYGQEIRPFANPKVVESIKGADCIIYSIGSLYTSIIPALILRGVGEAVASPAIRYKVLILNGSLDRETGPSHNPMTALDFIGAITRACSESRGMFEVPKEEDYSSYVTHVVYLEADGAPKVSRSELAALGIETIRAYGRRDEGSTAVSGRGLRYDSKALTQALEAVLGKRDPRAERSRRATLEHHPGW